MVLIGFIPAAAFGENSLYFWLWCGFVYCLVKESLVARYGNMTNGVSLGM
jgi:hypothetical protein